MPLYDICAWPSYEVESGFSFEALEAALAVNTYCTEANAEECRKGTQWTGVFAFNASVLIVTAINLFVMTLGAFWFYPRYFGALCNMCYSCCNCAAWITVLSRRFNPIGNWCSYNVAEYSDAKDTY